MHSRSPAIGVDLSGPCTVLWAHYEWRCERAADGFLRLYHHADPYGAEAVSDPRTMADLADMWLTAVKHLIVRPEELLGAGPRRHWSASAEADGVGSPGQARVIASASRHRV